MSGKKFREPIYEYALSVSHILRISYNMSRLQSEWLCFRYLDAIDVGRKKERLSTDLACSLYNVWERIGMSEFELIFNSHLLKTTSEKLDYARDRLVAQEVPGMGRRLSKRRTH